VPVEADSVEPTDAAPVIRGSAVLSGRACAAAPPPLGSARIVAADASAATTIVLARRVVRVLRISRSFLGMPRTGLARPEPRSTIS